MEMAGLLMTSYGSLGTVDAGMRLTGLYKGLGWEGKKVLESTRS